jgi:hypothetical protein
MPFMGIWATGRAGAVGVGGAAGAGGAGVWAGAREARAAARVRRAMGRRAAGMGFLSVLWVWVARLKGF